MGQYWEPPEGGVGGPEPIAPISRRGPREDKEITEGVRDAFILDPELDATSLDPHTENGIVHLHGTVLNERARQRAIDVALGVEGVKTVSDHLRIRER